MRIVAAILTIALTSCAGNPAKNGALVAAAADIGTTAIALNAGAVEMNPVGATLLKPVAFAIAERDPRMYKYMEAAYWGASANNLCVAIGGPVCLFVGLMTAVCIYDANN